LQSSERNHSPDHWPNQPLRNHQALIRNNPLLHIRGTYNAYAAEHETDDEEHGSLTDEEEEEKIMLMDPI
jgi:hypothetical protein